MKQSEFMSKQKSLSSFEEKFERNVYNIDSLQEQYPSSKMVMSYNDLLFMPPTMSTKNQRTLDQATQQIKKELSIKRTPQIESNTKYKKDRNVLVVGKNTVDKTSLNTATRLVQDEEIANRNLKNGLMNRLNAAILFNIIVQDYPQTIAQCIHYLTAITEKSQLSFYAKKTLNKDSISQFFSQAKSKCSAHTFYKYSSEVLNTHLNDIVQELNQTVDTSQIGVQIEIISLFLKTIFEFNEYLPQKRDCKSYIWHLKIKMFCDFLKINKKKFETLKRLFLKNYPRIIYISNTSQIHDLVITYYLILVKYKFSNANLLNFVNQFQQLKAEFKARKYEAIQRNNSRIEMTQIRDDKITLSQLYCQRRRIEKPNKKMSRDELIQTLQVFQEMLRTNEIVKSQKHPMLQYLAKKYKKNATAIQKKFRKHTARRKLIEEHYGSNLNGTKDILIRKQLVRNPNCSYEDLLNNLSYNFNVYIERSYFQDNINWLIAKEAHYQQLKYLKKLLKEADQKHKEGGFVYIVDSCSLIEGKESSIVVSVALAGGLTWKKSLGTMHFLQDVRQLLLGSQSSIIILFSDQFPFSKLENYDRIYQFLKKHTLFFLPRVSLAPNPCKVIANSIGKELQKRFSEQCDWEEALQVVVQKFDQPRVKQVVQKEWEKVQRLINLDCANNNQEEDKDKDEISIKKEENLDLSYGQPDASEKSEEQEVEEMSGVDELSEGLSSKSFPRSAGKEGNDPKNPNHFQAYQQAMENLQTFSGNEMRLALSNLIQLNTKKSCRRLFKFSSQN